MSALTTDEQLKADGWTISYYNGIKQVWRMSPTPHYEGDGGHFCERCQHYYRGENECPRHG